MRSKDFRGSVRENFILEASNLILIGFIVRIITAENCLQMLQFYFYCITDFKEKIMTNIYDYWIYDVSYLIVFSYTDSK